MRNKTLSSALFGLVTMLGVVQVHGEEQEQKERRWSGTVELGAVLTTGNTEEENLKVRSDWVFESMNWKHAVHFAGLRASQENQLTAHRIYSSYQADRKLNDIESVFARVSYEDDRFSGFDYQADFTGGYSRALLANETMTLDGDIGIGFRVSVLDEGDKDEEGIVRLAGAYKWQVTENARFAQLLSTEIGEEATISRSETSLAANINGSLAMKVSYAVKHNSEVPLGSEKTDTEASVTLVYEF